MSLVVTGAVVAGDLRVEVDLEVAPGETVAVLGPNGAGKSTLLRAIAGLTPLAEGQVLLDGEAVADVERGIDRPPEDRSVGLVFQDLLLFPHLDAVANVAFARRAAGRSRHEADEEARIWLGRLGLVDRAGARPAELSGGEAQRVALARALAAHPRALLLDEPLSALDAERRDEVRRTLRQHLRAHHGGPCLLVTHDPLDAAVLADRVVVLEAGQVTDAGTFAELVARPRSPWAAQLAGTNLLPGNAAGTRVTLAGGGEVVVADAPPTGEVLVSIRPAAVALHRDRPEGSPRNVWELEVLGTEGYGERVRVRLGAAPTLVAEVTADAVADLALAPGRRVWASVKATEVTAYPA